MRHPVLSTKRENQDFIVNSVVASKISKIYKIHPSSKFLFEFKTLLSLLRNKNRSSVQIESEFTALKQVSFSLKCGQSLGVIGVNGSGKSTLLQILAGTLQPSSGNILTKGRLCALLELGSGFNPLFSGSENIYLNAAIYGLSKNEIDERYSDIVSFADIGDFIEQPVSSYSSGMQLRLAFSVIANISPEILIIDEAFAVGDAIFMQKCMRFIREFRKTGTLILVSHDISAIKSLCDLCLWLHNGELREYGDPKEVCDSYLAYVHGQTGDLSEKLETKSVNESYGSKSEEIIEKEDTHFSNTFRFNDSSKGLGRKGAIVEEVCLKDSKTDKIITNVRGGERVTLSISIKINVKINHPVVGFIFRNRLGQDLFSENTYDKYKENPINLKEKDRINARFSFRMPILAGGDYSVTVAIADALNEDFDVHHWIYDALIISSISTSWSTGLVGIPMDDITLRKH